MIDIPNAFTPGEVQLLRDIARDKIVAECGSLLGFSTVALAQVSGHITSIDPHNGYPFHAPRPTWAPFLANLERYGVRDRVDAIQGFGQHVLPALKTRPDVCFMDLTGQYQTTRDCLAASLDIPLIAVHDYMRADCEGSTRAIDEFIMQYQPRVTRRDTLIVLER